LSEATVKVHLKAILRKIKVHNRTQAAIWAIQHGFRNHFPEGSSLIADARTFSLEQGWRVGRSI
jgi:two-component system, NarL family, nitrate/nitrite response regulator NarL